MKYTRSSHYLQPFLTHSSTTHNHFLLFLGMTSFIRSALSLCNQIRLRFSLGDSRIKLLGFLLQYQGLILRFLHNSCQLGFSRAKALKNGGSCKGVAVIGGSIERLGQDFTVCIQPSESFEERCFGQRSSNNRRIILEICVT